MREELREDLESVTGREQCDGVILGHPSAHLPSTSNALKMQVHPSGISHRVTGLEYSYYSPSLGIKVA